MVKMEHMLEKMLGLIGASNAKEDNWTLVRNEYQKPIAPLLDAKTGAELIVHLIRKSPCVRDVTMTIMHSCAAQCKTHLIRL